MRTTRVIQNRLLNTKPVSLPSPKDAQTTELKNRLHKLANLCDEIKSDLDQQKIDEMVSPLENDEDQFSCDFRSGCTIL